MEYFMDYVTKAWKFINIRTSKCRLLPIAQPLIEIHFKIVLRKYFKFNSIYLYFQNFS